MPLPSFLSADYLKIAVPAVGAVVAWFVDRHQRRALEEYQRREERYRELVGAIRGFYVDSPNPELKQTFIDQVNLSWLYCRDEVIHRAYAFLSTVHTDHPQMQAEKKEKALGELMVAIRKDLLSRSVVKRTALTANDFKLIAPK